MGSSTCPKVLSQGLQDGAAEITSISSVSAEWGLMQRAQATNLQGRWLVLFSCPPPFGFVLNFCKSPSKHLSVCIYNKNPGCLRVVRHPKGRGCRGCTAAPGCGPAAGTSALPLVTVFALQSAECVSCPTWSSVYSLHTFCYWPVLAKDCSLQIANTSTR